MINNRIQGNDFISSKFSYLSILLDHVILIYLSLNDFFSKQYFMYKVKMVHTNHFFTYYLLLLGYFSAVRFAIQDLGGVRNAPS